MKCLNRYGLLVGISIFLLNLFDGLMTMMLLSTGMFEEFNPLMSRLIESTGNWFLLPKILFGGIATIFLTACWKNYKVAKIGGLIALMTYVIIAINHIILSWKGGFLS